MHKIAAILTLLLCAVGCVQTQWGGAFYLGYGANFASDERISRGDRRASIDVDLEDGYGIGGRFEVRGKIREDRKGSAAWTNALLVGLAVDVSHHEEEAAEIRSLWPSHDVHDHGPRHVKRGPEVPRPPPEPTRVTSTVDVGFESVSLMPKAIYDCGWIRPFAAVGPALIFSDVQPDYYGASGESDTSIGFDARVGVEVPVTQNWGVFTEYRYLYTRPSYYYIEATKVEVDFEQHGVNLGLFCFF